VFHEITAVGSSSSSEKAQTFIDVHKIPNAKAHNNYDGSCGSSLANIPDLVTDPNVDVIYVATPHSHHYNNVKSALNAGKHVLCEKPLTGIKMFPRNNFADRSKCKAGQDPR